MLEKSCTGNDRNRRFSRPVDDSRCADCQNTDTARGEESAGKKISGIKRHLAVDSQGAPHAFATTAANATDRHGALLAFEQNREELSEVKSLSGDSGCRGKPFADGVKALLDEAVTAQIIKRNEMYTFYVIPYRRV